MNSCIFDVRRVISDGILSISSRSEPMTNANRVTMIRFLAFAVLLLAKTSWAQKRPPILEQIAKTYGIDSWDQIQAIRYTWNGEIPGVFKLAHAWEWEPKTGKISYEGKDKEGKPVKVTYISSELSSQSDTVKNEVEPAFVNDNYWLLFPFHAYWDTSATVTDKGMQTADRQRLGRAGRCKVSRGSRWLHARRYLGSLYR
jgi:hypothetical protein